MLLGSDEFLDGLTSSLAGISGSLVIASAFIKLEAFRSIAENLDSDLSLIVVSRWKAEDLVKGSSDLEVYEYCRENGWEFGINTRFHGKLFLIDDDELFLGSANLTKSGLNLTDNANLEFGTKFKPGVEDLEKVSLFLSSQVSWIDDDLYELMAQHVQEAKAKFKQTPIARWPTPIWQKVAPKVESLWLKDLLCLSPEQMMSNPPKDGFERDTKLLNCSSENLSSESLKEGFKETKIYTWVVDRLSSYEAVRFGALTSEIDNLLLDDPRLRRKYLKSYLVSLFSWLKYLDDEFEVTERSHDGVGSQTVRLRVENE